MRRAGDHVLAAVPVVWLTILFLVPLALTVVLSFGTSSFGAVRLGFSLQNYAQAVSPFYAATLLQTVAFAVSGSAICLVAGFPVAFVIARRAGRFRGAALAIVLLTYLTSLLIRVMAWQVVLASGGPLEAVLNALHLHSGRLDLLDSRGAVLVGTVAVYLPIAVIAMTVVLERIPSALLDAARDLGASPARVLVHVVLPLCRPGIATAALLTAVPMLGELVIPQLLGGGRGVLIGQAISTQYIQSQNYALGSAMVVLLVAIVAVFVAVLLRLSRGFEGAAR